MKRVILGNLSGFVTIFVVNGLLGCVGRTCTAGDVGVLGLGSVVAALVALRVWGRVDLSFHRSGWWLLVALVFAMIGALLYWLDIWFGFIVLPPPLGGGILDAVVNPLAVMASVAFLPLGASVAIASAVRAILLNDEANGPNSKR
ncbi:MAG: hypothetical protein KIS62_06855 [Ramlibacter sp.]|nr:hypothetical protein [Ramlibacter sp.]